MKKYPIVIVSAFLTVSPYAPAKAQDGDLNVTSPIPFKGVAKLVSHYRKNKLVSMSATYPQFLKITPVTQLANWKLRTDSQQRYQGFITQMNKDDLEKFKPIAPYDYQEQPELHYFYAPRLVSTAYSFYQYTGGAHGFGATHTTNFGQFAGMTKPKVLTLGDFFSGTTYRKTVEKKLIDVLRTNKNQEATWIHDGSVKSLTTAQLNNFTVSPKGLTWYFAPYEVGPYAAGAFDVTLTYKQLSPDFKRSVVLGR